MHLAGKAIWVALTACAALQVAALRAQQPQANPTQSLKGLTLEELSQIEVTTPAKRPEPAFRTSMAIFVITSEEIRRSGSTTVPEALRLARASRWRESTAVNGL